MAIDFRTPDEIADEYLSELKVLKPDVNTSQTDSDWWIRSRVVGGVVSGVYADQRLIANDAFPQRARHDALGRFLELYLNDTFKPSTAAVGNVKVTGTPGSSISVGQQFSYDPNGNIYQAASGLTLSATAGLVAVQSVSTGQNQNLFSLAPLTVVSPPAGIDATAAASGNFTDGRDDETDAEAAARILARIQSPISGGTQTDYEQWALEADASVVASNIIRYPYGFGTVGVVISAGTTDIDKALDEGEPIVLIPSAELLQIVTDYISTKKPLTDCVTVFPPSGLDVDVTIRVKLASGSLSTVPIGQTLTQEALIQREVERAIYKTPPGGRQVGATGGFLLASEIEEVVDIGLSASPYIQGKLELLLDRRVDNLDGANINLELEPTQIPIPGTISVIEMDN